MNRYWWVLGAWMLVQSGALAQACNRQSPAHSVALLELYTSEGCSSCPPADALLGKLRGAGIGPDRAVLLSLHVDYWNHIGWKDPYSQAAFTERQRWMSDLAMMRTIYTPEFFVAGKELRNWSGGVDAAVKRVNARAAQANIGIALGTPTAAGLPLEVKASAARAGKLFVALYESGITSRVKAGENDGRTLKHDFVVREWLAPLPLRGDGKASVSRVLPMPRGGVAANLGVAAFVQTDEGEVLQALSLDSCATSAGTGARKGG
jgi:hypothetical protein